LNWGNGGRYSFQNIWNYSSCPILSGKDCSYGSVSIKLFTAIPTGQITLKYFSTIDVYQFNSI
jgi:hypothetical protein